MTPRRFAILALGSRGDVQPFVALGRGLTARGHRATIAAAEDYEPLVREHGLAFAPLVGRIADLMDHDLTYRVLDAGGNPLPFARRAFSQVAPMVEQLVLDSLEASRDADALVVSTLGQHPGETVAEALGGVPLFATHFHPYAPTAAHPHMFFPPAPRPSRGGRVYHRATHALGEQGMRQFLRPAINRARRRLGLKPLGVGEQYRRMRGSFARGVHLHAYSLLVAPAPPDWDAARHVVTGYWPLPRLTGWMPPPDLAAFLESGPRPVYVGFGSILAGRDPDGVTRSIADALERAGQRGVLYRGWGDVGNVPLPPTVHVTGGAYHDWLFPRCRAVVHHGGAGTTAAALRAGVPAVAVPFFGDQRFWARRLESLGAGVALPRANLTAATLADALARLLADEAFAGRAADLGRALAAEDGVARAVGAIEARMGAVTPILRAHK